MKRCWIASLCLAIALSGTLSASAVTPVKNIVLVSTKVLNPAWQSKPSWLIADANDRMVPPQYERDTAKYIHAKLTVLAAGHVPMLSMPERVAAVIIDAANSSAK